MSAVRGKSNKVGRFNKDPNPENIETDKIIVDARSDYTPSPERLAKEASEARSKGRSVDRRYGALHNKDSAIWNNLGDDVEYIGETDWSAPRRVNKKSNDDSKPDDELHKSTDDNESCFWDTLDDDIPFVGETDWDALRISNERNKNETECSDNDGHGNNDKSNFWSTLGDDITYVGETDWDELKQNKTVSNDTKDDNSDNVIKLSTRRTSKSKASSNVSIRKCRRCSLDCEYGAYLCGEPINRVFTFNKSTCPKR